MSGPMPPLPNTPSWRGAQLKRKESQGQPYLQLWVSWFIKRQSAHGESRNNFFSFGKTLRKFCLEN
jgi:hypothetical protein